MSTSVTHLPCAATFDGVLASDQVTLARLKRVLPLWRLLMSSGQTVSPHALLDACGEALSLPAMANVLRQRGLPARYVRVRRDEVTKLSTPTLLQMEDSSVALLVSIGRFRATLDHGDGRHVTVGRRTLQKEFAGFALDRSRLGAAATERGGYGARLFEAAGEQAKPIGVFLVTSALLQCLSLLPPFLSRYVMDRALPDGARNMLWLLAVGSVLIAVHRAWLGLLRQTALRVIDGCLQASLLRGMFDTLLGLPLSVQHDKTVGHSSQVLASTENVTKLLTQTALVPAVDAVLASTYLVALAWTSLPLTVVVVGLAVMLTSISAVIARRYSVAQRAGLSASAKSHAVLFELMSGAATIQASGASRAAIGRWLGFLADEQGLRVQLLRIALWMDVLFEGAARVATLAALLWAGKLCLEGQLTVGALVASLQLTRAFMDSMQSLSHAALPIFGARADLERIREPLDAAVEANPDPRPKCGTRTAAEVIMEDVWFRYTPDGPWVLRGVNLRVAAGQLHRVSGPSGMGKTTLLRLVAGLLVPERGVITIAGKAPSSCRSDIAYLPQDTYLFEGTIIENVRLMSQAASEDIERAAHLTGLDSLLAELPMGWDTILPPGARTLSGGQRQLIVLTAAVASRRSLILLDEAMSHMDRLSQARLAQSPLFRERTVLTVVHDLIPKPRPAFSPTTTQGIA